MTKHHSQQPAHQAPRLLSTEQAAEFLDTRPNTLEVWRSTGRYNLRYVKIGRNVRYKQEDLEEFLRLNTFGIAEAPQ
jgi:excisionase family DNA binding protein